MPSAIKALEQLRDYQEWMIQPRDYRDGFPNRKELVVPWSAILDKINALKYSKEGTDEEPAQ